MVGSVSSARLGLAGASLFLATMFAAVSCENASFDELVQGKACAPGGGCAEGYLCDAANVCVPEGALTGSTTSSASASSSSGSGGSSSCNSITDCPAPPSACETPVCLGGECGTIAVPSGTPVPADQQTAGDCKTQVCDGIGHAVMHNDDLDLPVDGTVCTTDVCTSGVASNAPRQLGVDCAENGGTLCDAVGTCVECLTESDCTSLPPDNECRTRVCSAGKCSQSFGTPGLAVSVQVQGNCKKRVCDGAGTIVDQVDATDLPSDGNDCTDDVCSGGGSPMFPPKTSGATCMAGLCNSVGQCIGCVVASDCSGTDGFCGTRTCDAGACGFQYASSGTPLPSAQQPSGDCQTLTCNGSGGVNVGVADNDVPVDDGNECTLETCASGVPVHPAVPFDAPCTLGGVVCDGAGACVACNHSNQCPNSGTVCQDATCANNQCGVANRAAGAPADAGAQTLGDCKIVRCDGSGQPATRTADDGDLPVDGNDCTNDLCANGVASNPPVPAGTACGVGGLCDGAGNCANANKPLGATCASGGECGSQKCVDGVCCGATCGGACEGCSAAVTSGADGQCGFVPIGQDPDVECPAGETCGASGCAFQCGAQPTPPPASCPLACTGGCVNGTCVIDCNATGACSGATLTCPDGFDCQVLCGGSSSCANAVVTCNERYACDVVCSGSCTNLDLQCGSGVCSVACGAGTVCSGVTVGCGASTCAASCVGSTVFPTVACGGSCDCSTCELANGDPCTTGAQCASGNCPSADGVCCDTACSGTCSSCRGVQTGGVDGTCGFVKASTDPANECAGSSTCNGMGVCQLKPAGAACSAGTECQSGICPTQDGVCCSTTCGALCTSCLGANTGGMDGTCANITVGKDPSNECAGTATCNGMGACSLAPNGATCTNGAQCQSGICPSKDHVCCATACTGSCQSCVGTNNGGMSGTCGNILVGLDPDSECPGPSACSGAGACN